MHHGKKRTNIRNNTIKTIQLKLKGPSFGFPRNAYIMKVIYYETLELRRLYLDLVYVYKILFGMVETEVSTHFVLHKLDTGKRGHSLKLFAHHSRIDARKHFFCNRVVQCWNSLPATPTDFSSLTCFRSLLKRTDLSRFRIGKD